MGEVLGIRKMMTGNFNHSLTKENDVFFFLLKKVLVIIEKFFKASICTVMSLNLFSFYKFLLFLNLVYFKMVKTVVHKKRSQKRYKSVFLTW